jgi:hypothetical protein
VKRPGCQDQHWFYRWPEPPYLDNAAECVIVYATPHAEAVDRSEKIPLLIPSNPGELTEAVRMSEAWQPIETAPKDGTPVLIYQPDSSRKKVMEAWWALEYEDGPGYWQTPIGPAGRGYTILPKAVTHWQALPPPPVEQATAARLGVKMGDV